MINYRNPLNLDEFQYLETYLLNSLNDCEYHYYNDEICQSPHLKQTHSYNRNYITFTHNKVTEGQVSVPVLYCDNDQHYHAILPLSLIVPHCQYSLSFILSVIFDKLYSILTVDEIADKYNISKSTIYRWIERYSSYLHYYYQLRHKYHRSLFITLTYLSEELIDDIFEVSGKTLFQYDCKLLKPPS